MSLDSERLTPHIGHAVEIVTYAQENIALECVDCSQVIVDYDYDPDKEVSN